MSQTIGEQLKDLVTGMFIRNHIQWCVRFSTDVINCGVNEFTYLGRARYCRTR